MRFATPIAFILLLFLPYFIWLGRPRKGKVKWRDGASLGLRLFILLLLILSLAGTEIVKASDDVAVVFLLDRSDSIGLDQSARAEEFIRRALEIKGLTDQSAVVVFGSNALVDQPMSANLDMAPITSIPDSLNTDYGQAIRLGMALLPTGSTRRLLLLSDSLPNQGDSLEAAKLAAASGVEIDTLYLAQDGTGPEVLLSEVDAPTKVSQGEIFNIEITVVSSDNVPATLRVINRGRLLHEAEIHLRRGDNFFTVPLQSITPEFARYEVQIETQIDTYYQNNRLASFTEIAGPPKILLISEEERMDEAGNFLPDEAAQLQEALEATGLIVERSSPALSPAGLADLGSYDSVLLANVNAKSLSQRKIEALKSYVQDLGGGLVVIGGPESFGMGGYFQTPLEEILPVDMNIKDQQRFPSVSIALVIDRSGSMAAAEGGVAKIQLAAEGAARVVELLNDFDEITIIAIDTEADAIIGPTLVAEREDIIVRIRQIGAGGGGIFVRTGLEAAAKALEGSTNQVKHIILLADGADSEQKEGVPALIEELTEEGVTVSTVSIGAGPDVAWLQDMAEVGDGRFHLTDRAANLPQIFTQETTFVQRSYLVEEPFFPELGGSLFSSRHALIKAMESAGIVRLPPLNGYVGTSPKATAQLLLETHLGDPLLAVWENGLGRTAAWTSDTSGRWAANWVTWPGFAPFWSNVIRWSIQEERGTALETMVNLQGEEAQIVVDVRDENNQYLNKLLVEATIVTPDGDPQLTQLQQVSPGQYAGSFKPTEEGAYLIRVEGKSLPGETISGQTSGWVLGYSPEYASLESDPQGLDQIAQLTGGRSLSIEDESAPAAVFEDHRGGVATVRPIWPWLVGLAILLLPLDIAIRRLAITKQDLRRAWQTITGRFRSQPTHVPGRSEQVARLFQAKDRVSAPEIGESEAAIPTAIPGLIGPSEELTTTEEVGATGDPRSESSSHQDAGRGDESQSLASLLLEKKRRRESKTDEGEPE